jgi:Gpi18-like mannosyltransferase
LKNQAGKTKSRLLLILAVCPASIMISGFHGNPDPVMIFVVLLSIYLLDKHKTPWLSGLVFGLALSIKVVPLIFVPAFFFYLTSLRARATFVVTAAGIFLIGAMPYIWLDPRIIAVKVFGYSCYYVRLGLDSLVKFSAWASIYLTPRRSTCNHQCRGKTFIVTQYLGSQYLDK